MKFSYRGVKYNQEPLVLEMMEGEQMGRYRGQTLKYRYPKHINHLQPRNLQYKYRGVGYIDKPLGVSDNLSVSVSGDGNQSCVCSISQNLSKKPKITTTAQIHLENLRQKLEHRLQVAKSRGDLYLINLLEKEYQQLTQVI
jgi:hypothetical protein